MVSAGNYSVNKWEQFNGISDFAQGFLQGLIGNVISFNNLYLKITAADLANTPAVAALAYGKIVYLLISFAPIDLGS
jgi:hypothetical protein